MKKINLRILAVATGVLLYVPTFAQKTISGKIIDASINQPLSGATILLENSMQGTTSDLEGNFKLSNLKSDTYKIKISFVGYETVSVVRDLKSRTQAVGILNPDSSQSIPLQINLKRSTYNADEVVVSATRTNEQSAMAYSNISGTTISKQNLGQDLPVLLNFTPSLVSTSDAGAGVGYTGMRIRGTDATRINVTINGIPLNDAESQGVYWVNMPDFASSVSSIQIQRGVGTSTNGAAAFGASVNVQTNEFRPTAYAELNNTYGSFNTWKHSIKAGTGLLNGKFTLDARLSKVSSDGFIDRASSNLKSFYVSGAYFSKKSMWRANVFLGKEKTYQAWAGIPESRLRNDKEDMMAYIERNGLNERDANNLLNSDDRKYNSYLYKNQTDNYWQNHFQLISSHTLSPNLTLNVNAFLVRGRGYYEEFRDNDALLKYKLANVIVGGQTIENSDLVRQRWLDNYFYGSTFSFDYNSFSKLKVNIGGGWNEYDGKHFGDVVWAKAIPNINQRYYDSKALKTDFNLYVKVYYSFLEKLTAFADLQTRTVGYSIEGDDNQQRQQKFNERYQFLNPKLGLTYKITDNSTLYTSYSVGNREPNRDDLTESTPENYPKAERLNDWELGYRLQKNRFSVAINAYYMNYKNQLVLTGKVNDVGNPIKTNTPESYRQGIEVEAAIQLSKRLRWNGNFTLSQNKIKDFREAIPNYDDGSFKDISHGNSDISFSPNSIVGSQLMYAPIQNLEIALLSKYVGRQFLDNTANVTRQLNAYSTSDLRLIYSLKPKFCKEMILSLLFNNILGKKYESNGYTYSYIYGGTTTTENFYYPQAGRNFLMSVAIKL